MSTTKYVYHYCVSIKILWKIQQKAMIKHLVLCSIYMVKHKQIDLDWHVLC